MSVVIPFSKCIARPRTESSPRQKLSVHLLEVALRSGSKSGSICERLLYLAGLVHDAGKATYGWQRYIVLKEKGMTAPRVPHSHVGSCLFFWAATELLKKQAVSVDDRRDIAERVLWITVDIASHHGVLDDIPDTYPPWEPELVRDCGGRLLADTDLQGLLEFVDCEMGGLGLSAAGFDRWFGADGGRDSWARTVSRTLGALSGIGDPPSALAARLLRLDTSRLIESDRLSASGGLAISEPVILEADARAAADRITQYCLRRRRQLPAKPSSSKKLFRWRNELQKHSLEAYLAQPDAPIYSLQLPTGCGKTICSLRIALSAVQRGKCKRIIYVAPYLSILSQATSELRDSTGMSGIMQHDSVTRLDALIHEATHKEIDHVDSDQAYDLLALESWNAPIVTTTFNQLFRAFFPRTAQQAMRLKALEGAFIIMDELQSVDAAKWKLFLTTLEALTHTMDAQALLVTATLPDTAGGLSRAPVELGTASPPLSRYGAEWDSTPVGSLQTARIALSYFQEGRSVAVILNTIRDACDVYRKILNELGIDYTEREPEGVVVLSGLMTPIHKSTKIERIKESIKSRPILVICTQVLEAGVDLSFDLIVRAIAPLPCLIQAAGRVNRHNERSGGVLRIINYVRDDGTDGNRYVYDRDDLDITRRILDEHGGWREPESAALCRRFYGMSFERARREALLQYLQQARLGAWSLLGGLEPFGGWIPTVPVFVVPRECTISEKIQRAMECLGIDGPEHLWNIYTSSDRARGMSVPQRRALLALLQFFTVPVSHTLASSGHFYAVSGKPFLRLTSETSYREDTGLMHLGVSDDLASRMG